MSNILAGIDISGDNIVGNYKFMGIVFGTEEYIRSTVKSLGSNKIHMVKIKDKDRQDEIISKLIFNNKDNISFCVRIDRDVIIKKIKKLKIVKGKKITKIQIFRTYHYVLLKQLREKIEKFLINHNFAITDIVFQCDGDCRRFLKDNGLQHADEGDAYMLSDIVAWANNRGKEPDGVITINLTDMIERELKRIFS